MRKGQSSLRTSVRRHVQECRAPGPPAAGRGDPREGCERGARGPGTLSPSPAALSSWLGRWPASAGVLSPARRRGAASGPAERCAGEGGRPRSAAGVPRFQVAEGAPRSVRAPAPPASPRRLCAGGGGARPDAPAGPRPPGQCGGPGWRAGRGAARAPGWAPRPEGGGGRCGSARPAGGRRSSGRAQSAPPPGRCSRAQPPTGRSRPPGAGGGGAGAGRVRLAWRPSSGGSLVRGAPCGARGLRVPPTPRPARGAPRSSSCRRPGSPGARGTVRAAARGASPAASLPPSRFAEDGWGAPRRRAGAWP